MQRVISTFCCDQVVNWLVSGRSHNRQHQRQEADEFMGCGNSKEKPPGEMSFANSAMNPPKSHEKSAPIMNDNGSTTSVPACEKNNSTKDDEAPLNLTLSERRRSSVKSGGGSARLSGSGGCTDEVGAFVRARVHFGRDVEEDHVVEKDVVLGRGYSGPVIKGKEKLRGIPVAIKSISKQFLSDKQWDDLRNECEVYLSLDHPNIAKLRDVYETQDSMTLVMQFCSGGELFGRLCKRQIYDEPDAAACVSGMLLAVRYLHDEGVVHRDLKLQNWLYPSQESADGDIKLIDFGFSKFKADNPSKWEAAGSIEYMPPEVFRREKVGPPCDMWAMGVIIFMLLSGYPPFHGDAAKIMRNVANHQILWLSRRWQNVSKIGRNMVERLMNADPAKRLTAAEALEHGWLKIHESSKECRLDASLVQALSNFSKQSRLRKAVCMMMSHCLSPQERFEIEETFKRMDTSKTGTIVFSELKEVLQKRTDHLDDGANPGTDGSSPGKRPCLQRMTTKVIGDVFSSLDMHGEDKVYYTDFCTAVLSHGEKYSSRENILRATFERMDADYSGVVSVDNLRHIFGDQFEGVSVEELLREADADGDGCITFSEFSNFMNKQGAGDWSALQSEDNEEAVTAS